MIIQDLLGALARRLETGSLSLDTHQLCCLKVNTLEMTLEYMEQQNWLFVYLNVGPLSAAQDSILLADILAANLFHCGTSDGAAFGLDQEKAELLLFRRFQLPVVEEASFVSACVQMIEVANVWQKKLLHSSTEPSSPPRLLAHQELTLNMAGKIR
ncbi:type III secretion system chaperone [Pantoea agglomerans]|uniref:Type III secretion system chaperone n=1 Tax=Enterobacter agglomerans TaxID=549 RepID=A0AAN2FI38_ENTAG|nr:type III secretion system chaperone [Pantoea agglomerans]CAH6374165.1 type III secretion system chaperone [Pantoea agglomerans]